MMRFNKSNLIGSFGEEASGRLSMPINAREIWNDLEKSGALRILCLQAKPASTDLIEPADLPRPHKKPTYKEIMVLRHRPQIREAVPTSKLGELPPVLVVTE